MRCLLNYDVDDMIGRILRREFQIYGADDANQHIQCEWVLYKWGVARRNELLDLVCNLDGGSDNYSL